jgi:membrane-bound lytic murein transglycosylase A
MTGYYEPQLSGSRKRVAPYLYPLYQPPADLLTIDLPALTDDDLRGAWPALVKSCEAFARKASPTNAAWEPFCRAAANTVSSNEQRTLLTTHLRAWRITARTNGEASGGASTDIGRMTGYYEPQLSGSRKRGAPYLYPLYQPPADLLTIDLPAQYPQLAGLRLRGRLDGRRVVPYWTRAELQDGARLRGLELVWVDDPIEAFFLQVQGSGRVRLADGSLLRVGFADTNGHPYRSIGQVLIERGELRANEASMQSIQVWARAHPAQVPELLANNPGYVFFRELPLGDAAAGPIGALNVALTPGYSLAVDPRFIPLGSPVIVSTVHPATQAPLARLMLAQDTGTAIRGPLRFDFFWGFGNEAGAIAGRQRHDVRAWLLLPTGITPGNL